MMRGDVLVGSEPDNATKISLLARGVGKLFRYQGAVTIPSRRLAEEVYGFGDIPSSLLLD